MRNKAGPPLAAVLALAGVTAAYRTSYAPRPGRLLAFGAKKKLLPVSPDAQPPARPLPTGDDYVSVGAGESHALAVRSSGAAELWGRDRFGAAADLAAAQPRGAGGGLANASDAFVLSACGKDHWLALTKGGRLVTGGGQDVCSNASQSMGIPPEMHAVIDTELPLGGQVIGLAAGGGSSFVILRRHDEAAAQGGRLYAWDCKGGWWTDAEWSKWLNGPNEGFMYASAGDKVGGAASRADGSAEAFRRGNAGDTAAAPAGTGLLDYERGGGPHDHLKIAWIAANGSVAANSIENIEKAWSGPKGKPYPWDPPGTPVGPHPAAGKVFAALSLGRTLDAVLQHDGTVRVFGQCPDPACQAAAAQVATAGGVLAITQGMGFAVAITAADGAPVSLPPGAGRAPP